MYMKKIAVAVTVSSGSVYARLFLQKLIQLKDQCAEDSVVISDTVKFVWKTDIVNESYSNHPFQYFTKTNVTAPYASGSAGYDALVIIPFAMGTLGSIAPGVSID